MREGAGDRAERAGEQLGASERNGKLGARRRRGGEMGVPYAKVEEQRLCQDRVMAFVKKKKKKSLLRNFYLFVGRTLFCHGQLPVKT